MVFRWEDELGNVHGRSDGANATAPALLLGSHLVRTRATPNLYGFHAFVNIPDVRDIAAASLEVGLAEGLTVVEWVVQDTVIDAGKYDGALGIVAAIAAVKALKLEGKLKQFPRPIEVGYFFDASPCLGCSARGFLEQM